MTTQQVDPLRACKEARDKLKRVRQKLFGHGQFFGNLATALCEDEVSLRLANSDLTVPIDVPGDRMLDYNAWPQRDEVKASLAEYYGAVKEYQAAYYGLAPDEQRLFGSAGSESDQRLPQRTVRRRRV